MFPVLAVGATAVVGYGIYSFVQNRKKAQKDKEILDEMVGWLETFGVNERIEVISLSWPTRQPIFWKLMSTARMLILFWIAF